MPKKLLIPKRRNPVTLFVSAKAQQLFSQAVALHQKGQVAQTSDFCKQVLKIAPNHFDALHLLGVSHIQAGQLQVGIDFISQAIKVNPSYADAYRNRGVALVELKQLDAAVASYDKAIALKPGYAEAYLNRGVALKELKQLDAAVASYDKAIASKPGYAEAYSNRGIVLKELKQMDAALASFDKAIALKPDYAEPYSNRGNVLKELKQLDAAVASYDKAIALNPGYAEAYLNRGVALKELKQLDAAVASYDKAIALKPDHADANWNKALTLLLAGDFESGWPLYDWRWKRSDAPKRMEVPLQEWDGSPIQNELLVLAEQGLGDEIFYLGMLQNLVRCVSSLTVAIDKRLIKTLQRSFMQCKFIPSDIGSISNEIKNNKNLTAYVFMGSLGRYFRRSINDFSTVKPGYLKACNARTQTYREKVEDSDHLICGISWRSKNKDFGEYKSLNLLDLSPIFDLRNFRFVNLQYGDTEEEQLQLKNKMNVELTKVQKLDNTNDIDGLAALICACDIIVTVSNTTAHLAAALGRPALVILPSGAGLLYYWHLDRDHSPWYPSVKLYRQGDDMSWDPVLKRVASELQTLATVQRTIEQGE